MSRPRIPRPIAEELSEPPPDGGTEGQSQNHAVRTYTRENITTEAAV